jgi:hypothetical protein
MNAVACGCEPFQGGNGEGRCAAEDQRERH